MTGTEAYSGVSESIRGNGVSEYRGVSGRVRWSGGSWGEWARVYLLSILRVQGLQPIFPV